MTRPFAPLASLVLVSALAAACGARPAEEVDSDVAVPVTTATVALGRVTAVVRATAMIAPAPGAELIVIAPQPGRLAAVPKAEGDAVRRGDVLARFEIPTAVADVAKQRAELARARARLVNARAARARAGDLFDRGVAARKEVEDADRDVADAEADVAAAEAGGAAAETSAERAVVRAPFDGVVARRLHNPGDLVDASSSDPVLRLVDPQRVEAVAAVPFADAARVLVGAHARAVDVPKAPALTVVAHASAVTAGTATVPVRLRFAAPPRLAIGQPIQLEIDAETHESVVVVPTTALVREAFDVAVFVVAGDKAQRRAVTVGLTGEQGVEITRGLAAGDVVLTSGQNGLPDGATVSVGHGAGAAGAGDGERPATKPGVDRP